MSYWNSSKLKQFTINLLVKMLKPKEVEDLTQIFESIDVNKTGFIDIEEFKQAIWIKNNAISEDEI